MLQGASHHPSILPLALLKSTPQPTDGVSYARKVEKAEAAVDWTDPADVIERRIRAFDPFPGVGAELGGESVKLWRARVVPLTGSPGQILASASLTLATSRRVRAASSDSVIPSGPGGYSSATCSADRPA